MWNHAPGGLVALPSFSQHLHHFPFYSSLLHVTANETFTAVIMARTPLKNSASPLIRLIKQLGMTPSLAKVGKLFHVYTATFLSNKATASVEISYPGNMNITIPGNPHNMKSDALFKACPFLLVTLHLHKHILMSSHGLKYHTFSRLCCEDYVVYEDLWIEKEREPILDWLIIDDGHWVRPLALAWLFLVLLAFVVVHVRTLLVYCYYAFLTYGSFFHCNVQIIVVWYGSVPPPKKRRWPKIAQPIDLLLAPDGSKVWLISCICVCCFLPAMLYGRLVTSWVSTRYQSTLESCLGWVWYCIAAL